MRTLLFLPAFVVACGRTTSEPVEDTESDPLVKACDVNLDEASYQPDARLLRWPYSSHVTSEAVTLQWALPPGVTGKVNWGTDGNLGTVAEATQVTLDQLVEPVVLHRTRIEGLVPNTIYCYQLEIDGEDVSGPLTFRTAPLPDSVAPIRFMVMGDYGTGIGIPQLVLNQIKPYFGEIDFWLTTGDNAYGSGTTTEWHNNVFAFYRDLLRRVPYFPTAGNHDYDNPFGLQPMLDSVDLPKQAYRPDDHGRYYAFDWGPVHFNVLDTQLAIDLVTPEVADDDMVDWLEDDLADNQARPWRFAAWHHPMYYTEPGRSTKASMKTYLQPVVEGGNVEVTLAGHSHVYEAYLNLKGDTKVERGTTYITTGGGGAPPDRVDGEDHAAELALRDFGRSANHFMLFTVDPCRVEARAIDKDGVLMHTFELTRDCE